MTNEEARKLAAIGLTVDGGCSVCVRGIFVDFFLAFPEHEDIFAEIYDAHKYVSDPILREEVKESLL